MSRSERTTPGAILNDRKPGAPIFQALGVEEHSVTLSGKVDSWLEKRAVLGIVSHTPGVRRVNDALEVDPYHS